MKPLLPLFPLKLVVFPGEKLKLHIFEPRYKELINECREAGATFGIPPYLDEGLASYGTEVAIEKVFSVYDNGEMDILTEGKRVFRLDKFVRSVPDRLYSAGEVTFIENEEEFSSAPKDSLVRDYQRFHKLLDTGYERDRFDARNLSFQIAQEVGLNLEQKVELLSMPRETDRLALIQSHLNQVVPLLAAADETKRRIRGNGHFNRFPSLEL